MRDARLEALQDDVTPVRGTPVKPAPQEARKEGWKEGHPFPAVRVCKLERTTLNGRETENHGSWPTMQEE